jgi:hypothetical protein
MIIYIDDSGTSPENAVAVAAGWIAHTHSWLNFQTEWNKARAIDVDTFDSMHMAEFVFGRRGTEFEGWFLEKKQRISAGLRDVIGCYSPRARHDRHMASKRKTNRTNRIHFSTGWTLASASGGGHVRVADVSMASMSLFRVISESRAFPDLCWTCTQKP